LKHPDLLEKEPMRKVVFALNVSLDGFADHDLHDFFRRYLESVEVVLFGRITYQMMAAYWPQADHDPRATPSTVAFAHRYNAMPKVVFSKTLHEASWTNTRLVRTDPVEEALRLKGEQGGNLSAGSLSLIQTFLKHGLIDECWLVIHPVIWGSGKRLFADGTDRTHFRLEDSLSFRSGAVVLHYSLVRS
jgi:dihydrofolate reductase